MCKRERCEGKSKFYTPTDHVAKRVILLDDFYGSGIRNFRVLGHFDPTRMDLGVNILQVAYAKPRTASRPRQGHRAHICLARS